ncbi:MAG TPA: hypothetical protein VGG24_14050 [Paraburkholderia sp.]|jgi:hypothetical protein
MTPERFHTLVDAWGADSRRWPDAEREDALAWARAHRAEADAAFAAARDLDAWLACDPLAPPSHALVERIVAGAPARIDAGARRRRFWWSGVGVAGVGLAGALAGAVAMSFVVLGSPPPSANGSGHGFAAENSAFETGFGSPDSGSVADWGDE